jgi:hypothetical protein
MASQRLSENLINICIVPKSVHWPESNAAPVWAKAHACVDALHALVRKVDAVCLEAEEDAERSAGGIARQR